jgi:hypothetical protein
MVILEKRALLREPVKRGCVLGCYEVGTHAIPDNNDDVLGLA